MNHDGSTIDGCMLYLVKQDELKTHLHSRFVHHTKRNKELLDQANKLKEELDSGVADQDTVSDRMAFKGSSDYRNDSNRRDMLFNNAREHARKAALFHFLSEHSGPYQELFLSQEELTRLEFVS